MFLHTLDHGASIRGRAGVGVLDHRVGLTSGRDAAIG